MTVGTERKTLNNFLGVLGCLLYVFIPIEYVKRLSQGPAVCFPIF